jgi:hypothetical protein
MKLMYMMALGIPVYTLSPKKVKQCLMFLKEKEPGTLKKKEEEPARAYRYNIVLEHRRKKTVFPLAENNSICQVQPGVKMEERLAECGLEYASGMSFSISQPKKKWSIDCVCLSWETYNAWMRGLIRLLKDEGKDENASSHKEPTRDSESHTPDMFCDCGSLSVDLDLCKTCGRSKDPSFSSLSSSITDSTPLGSSSPLASALASPKSPPPKPPRKIAASGENSGSRSSTDELLA